MSVSFSVMRGDRLVSIVTSGPVRALAWVMLAGATCLLVRAEAIRADRPEGVRSFPDLVYREDGGHRFRLDVYVPDAPPVVAGGGRPVVVAIHGGVGGEGASMNTVDPSPLWSGAAWSWSPSTIDSQVRANRAGPEISKTSAKPSGGCAGTRPITGSTRNAWL